MNPALPDITFYKDVYTLKESDFDCDSNLSVKKTMEFMQNAATAHADILGFGWNALHAHGILWVLSKAKVRFVKQIDKTYTALTVYTWPLKPDRFFAAREFVAVDCEGQPLFYATTLWNLIDINKRNILSADKMSEFYQGEYSQVLADISRNFTRIKRDDDFQFAYIKTVRRSDLDLNKHVNNTNYIAYACDAVPDFAEEKGVSAFEVTYHSECRLGEEITLYQKIQQNSAYVVGEKQGGKLCFTALLEK